MKGITITPETPNLIAIKSNMVILDKTPYRLATIQLDQINNTQVAHIKPIYLSEHEYVKINDSKSRK